MLERITEHGLAGKHGREKSWESKSPYTESSGCITWNK